MRSRTIVGAEFKPMDVAFGDTITRPRRLVLEVHPESECSRYTTCGESGGVGCTGALMTQEEWLKWLDRFNEDLTGRQIREAKEAATAPFTEPKYWVEFRERYAETGVPWIPNKL
jgi:hypothetical protein